MWVKFRLNDKNEWRYAEYPEEFYDFEDDDELGEQIWSDYYGYYVSGCLMFDRVDAPPKEEIRKLISSCWSRIADTVQEIEKYEKMLGCHSIK